MSARRGEGAKVAPLDNQKKGLKIVYKKILTCKRLPSYVMRGKAPMLCVTFSPEKAPILGVKVLLKKAPMLSDEFLPKRPHVTR